MRWFGDSGEKALGVSAWSSGSAWDGSGCGCFGCGDGSLGWVVVGSFMVSLWSRTGELGWDEDRDRDRDGSGLWSSV